MNTKGIKAAGMSMQAVNKLNFMVGGPAGTGVATMGLLFAKCLQRSGLEVYGTNDYPSLIKGGHNTYMVAASTEPITGIVGKFDILIALDKTTIERHLHELSEGAAVIYDSNKVKDAESLAQGKNLVFLGAPLTKMAAEAGGEIMFNTVALGASMGLLSLDFGIIENMLNKIWARKGKKVADANIAAAKAGYDFSKSALKSPFKIRVEFVKREKTMFINGNEAAVLGAIKAGCKFVAEYPMSPSSSILHLMAGHERDFGIIVKQTEDEIAAANMIAAAGFAGVRSMTATSGGGFSLMVEALGMMGIMEVPCVIFESQRCGPSTGLPTYTEQADLLFALHASQGEFPRVVIAPGDPVECYVEAFNAFNLAEKVQTPVIVLLDKFLSETSITVDDFRKIPLKVDRGKLMSDLEMEKASGFKRHAYSPDGISPRCLPGQKNGMYVCSSYEHDETGYTSEDPHVRVAMIDKRARKLSSIPQEMIAPTFFGAEESQAQLLLVCWGSTKMPALQALRLLEAEGVKIRMMHIKYASPFPAQDVLRALQSARDVAIFEGNSQAQMRSLIRQQTGFYIKKAYLRYDGRPFMPEEIAEQVKKFLQV
ncbi:MAG: 2-oxoacid:acceptor oxidoreductase subunit alpha [Candidatus Micrarchaeota archaeon]|nr:2-oxoacid:acceptor oxidoreductase subunit alpha [Candidatus Micrarchaeota archaeon]